MAHADEIDHSLASPSYQQSRCSFPPAEEACDWWKPNHYLCGDAWGEGPTHLRAKAKEFTMFARLRHRVLGMSRSNMLAVCIRVYIQYYSVCYLLHYIYWIYCMIIYCVCHFTIYCIHICNDIYSAQIQSARTNPRVFCTLRSRSSSLNSTRCIALTLSCPLAKAWRHGLLKIFEDRSVHESTTASKVLRCSQAEARKPRSEILSTRELLRAQRLRLQTQKLYPDMRTMSLDVTGTFCWGGEHVQLKDTESQTVHLRGSLAKSKHFQLVWGFWISRCGLVLEVQKRFPVLPFTLRAIEDEQASSNSCLSPA